MDDTEVETPEELPDTTPCARCGKQKKNLPRLKFPRGGEVRRFELYDAERDMYFCKRCTGVYNELMPMVSEYHMLASLPDLQASLRDRIPEGEEAFFDRLAG